MRPVDATVQQPRPFGYVVGDLIEQRVLLPAGRHSLQSSMPGAGRIGIWLERRTPRVASDSQGRHWLIVDYQLINAPQGLTTVNLPEWVLAAKGERPLRIPHWPVSVGPLTARTVIAQGGLQAVRGDRAAPSIPTEPIVQQLGFWSGAAVITIALWLGWLLWRNWRAGLNKPFARAAREMRDVEADTGQAFQALHRAFDRTAGRVVQRATLPDLFARAAYLEPFRPRIEEFFAHSAEHFFGGNGSAGGGASGGEGESGEGGRGRGAQPRVSALMLCRELQQIERRHER